MTFNRKEFYQNLMRAGVGSHLGNQASAGSVGQGARVYEGQGAKIETPLNFWIDYFLRLPAAGPFGEVIVRPPLSLWR